MRFLAENENPNYSYQCNFCDCCIKGKCVDVSECDKLGDMVIIVIAVGFLLLVVFSISLCYFCKKRSKEKLR